MTKYFSLIFMLFITVEHSAYAVESIHEDDLYWESEDLHPWWISTNTVERYVIQPEVLVANQLIDYYQKYVSKNSIDRCPFYISCSSYAKTAINRYGLVLGICYFIDRNYYRENTACYFQYGLRENKLGVLKLDDSLYLGDGINK